MDVMGNQTLAEYNIIDAAPSNNVSDSQRATLVSSKATLQLLFPPKYIKNGVHE